MAAPEGSRWRGAALKKLVHMHDVVDAVRLLQQPTNAAAAPATEPPSAGRGAGAGLLPFDLDAPAPVRPAASAPGRLDGRSSQPGAAAVQQHDFERDTCWVGSIRAVDATEPALKKIFERRCGAIRSMVVREKPDGAKAAVSAAVNQAAVKGKSWALVTFLQTEGKDRAVAAAAAGSARPLTGSGGYLIKAELLCLDDAFNSSGELLSVWKNAKAKAKETTSWDRTHIDAPPHPKRQRRHSTPGALLGGADGSSDGDSDGDSDGAKRRRLDPSGQGDIGTALRKSGEIGDISEVVKEAFLAKGTSGAVFRAQ